MTKSNSSRSSRPKFKDEDARTWANGLNQLLKSPCKYSELRSINLFILFSILPFEDGTALFRAFLQKEYAEENLDFILKVNAYKECSPRKRQKMAWKLYKTYIAIGATNELNLDILSRRYVPPVELVERVQLKNISFFSSRVTDLSMITPHLSTFDAAQKRILNLLDNDAYRRFLQWDIYLELADQVKHKGGGEQQQQRKSDNGNCGEDMETEFGGR